MSATEEQVALIVKGIDQGATKLTRDVTAGLKGIEGQTTKTASGVGRLTGALDTLKGRIKTGFEFAIGADLERFVSGALTLLPRAFFDAIDAGQSWVQTVKDIERVTGLSATQASEWAAVMEHVGVPLGNVQQILAMFGRNLADNEDLFKNLGIATRDANGDFLDAYTILTNTRRAFAAQGEQLANTGAAQELFSRSGYKMLEVLQLTDAQWAAYASQAAAAGQIVGGPLTDAVERFHRAQAGLNGVIQGLQTAIFAGVAPALETFVDSFTNWIQAHMQQIVEFVSQVANFIIGVIGGLFGLDFSAKTAEQSVEGLGNAGAKAGQAFDGLAASTKKAATGEDAMTTSLNAQIKTIDGQIAAIRRRSDALHAAEERARLDQALASAQAQLADLKGNAPFTEGLSNAEAVLARQKHAQDIVDAEKAVHDAQGSIAQFSADQQAQREIDALTAKKQRLQDELNAHKKALQAQAAGAEWLTGVQVQQDTTIQQKAGEMYAGITAAAQQWRDKGVAFSNDLKGAIGGVTDALLGTKVSLGPAGYYRTGGLIGALGGLAEVVGQVAGYIAAVVQWAASILPPAPKTDSAEHFLWGPSGSPAEGLQDLWAKIISGLSLGVLPGPSHHAAGGWVGLNGPELGWLGEEGPEYVVPNDQARAGGGASSYVPAPPIHIHIDGRKIFEIIDERLYIKAGNSPVGMSAYRNASG